MTINPIEKLHDLRACPDCGLFSLLPVATQGTSVHCPRCQKSFRRVRNYSYDYLFGCVIAGLLFCILTITAPFMNVILYGRFQISTLWTGPQTLQGHSMAMLATVVMLTTLIVPFTRFVLMNVTLAGARLTTPPWFTAHAFCLVKKLSTWAMLEVFLLGFLVAYKRLTAMAYVHIDTAVYALAFAILLAAMADASLDSEDLWNRIRRGRIHKPLDTGEGELLGCLICLQASRNVPGAECPRCGDTLQVRKKESMQRALALVIAALICYFPANYFPVMNITQLGHTTSYTIVGGMLEFLHNGFWPLALLIFTASILIPLMKIVLLIYLLVSTHLNSARHLLLRTQLYRMIRFIGRWSMVDIFMVSIMVALVQFGQIAHITPGIGGVYFASVVILTMLAVESFDTRLMWDFARKQEDALLYYGEAV